MLHDLTHPEDRPLHLQQHAQMLATGKPFRIESRLVRADASHVWAASHAALTRDGSGRLAGGVTASDGIAAGLKAGRFIRIDVGDTGFGMAVDVLKHATEPFFSTKARGHGTGLGLATVRGFAEQSGGRLVLRSQAGQGTTASLFLPQNRFSGTCPAEAADGAPASAAAEPRRIMLVDDDAEVLEAIDEMLEASGYAVESFGSTAPALSHLEHGGPADLLITDLSMPGTGGLELIGEAQRRWPGMPAILLTGYNGDELAPVTAPLTGGRLVVLQKPIRLGALLKQVAALLAEAGGVAG